MDLRAAGRRLLRGMLALVFFGLGCEVLVDGKLGQVLCTEEGAVGPPSCPDGALCRNATCIDMELAGRALGAPCTAHDHCGALDFCFESGLLDGAGGADGAAGAGGAGSAGGAAGVCARPCCSSSDCDPGLDAVCWIPPEGGIGLCRLGRAVGRPEVGTLLSGADCSSNGDCRSGMCRDGACLDSCCSDTNCAMTGQVCRLTSDLVSDGPAWACLPGTSGQLEYFAECSLNSDCSSGMCAEIEGIRRCTVPCCGSDMCPVALLEEGAYQVGCTEIEAGDQVRVRACAKLLSEDSVRPVGVPCTEDDECRGGMCVRKGRGTMKFCSDVCCGDASCGDMSRFGCRPPVMGPSWPLRCEPK
ncbi:hypothetical protein SOCE26_052550 [Sorangium cellulosum]|uniref:Uncharacterized protein n=1 Tax=Sorangium cellulosum TaxID=56 RepID=A0A2L0EWX5_SORCE|nr:hypothetical protein [Sorangium cellulosum]AUX43800.1 hypothetical protein SOCE26_052550 [Sorangium cellulosum]